MSDVKESAGYDNYMDANVRKNDLYSVSLDSFFDTPMDVVLQDNTKAKKSPKSDVWKSIYVHFKTLDDMADFCTKINQMIPGSMREIYHPLEDQALSLFKDEVGTVVEIDKAKLPAGEQLFGRNPSQVILDDIEVSIDPSDLDDIKWRQHWLGMPEFVQDENTPFRTITMKFRSKEDYDDFSIKIGQEVADKTKSIWHPELKITKNLLLRWIQPNGRTLTKYPMYIVSKGRADTMFTSRSLSRMEIPHYIVIEPQDLESYDKALDTFNMRQYVTLIVAPFSNHGDGPGRARNYAWDHSISIGATSHWVLDDNISDFYRLNRNQRIRFESGVGFQVMEDFVDRYETSTLLVLSTASSFRLIRSILLMLPTPVSTLRC
jgi:hypothetical protein